MGILDKKYEFINLDKKTAEKAKKLILDGYKLSEYPEKPILVYKKGNSTVVIKVKMGKLKCKPIKYQEARESFEAYAMGQDDHLHNEVGKLVAITGAALIDREEQLIILRRTFAPRDNEQTR